MLLTIKINSKVKRERHDKFKLNKNLRLILYEAFSFDS